MLLNNSLINGLCTEGRVSKAEELVFRIRTEGLTPDVITYNSLITGCVRVSSTLKALELYHYMKKLDIKPTLVTYHALINGISGEGKMKEIESLFRKC